MTEPVNSKGRLSGWRYRLFATVQLLLILFIALVELMFLMDAGKIALPGAPVALYFGGILFGAALIFMHWPRISIRLPKLARILAYPAIIGLCVVAGVWAEKIKPIWAATPEGKQEAVEQAARDRAKAELAAKNARENAALLAEADALLAATEPLARQAEQMKAAAEKAKQDAAEVERCFTFFGHHLPRLEEEVRESLHNPKSFEHVKTTAIDPNGEGQNVQMVFRAENAFGAIRTTRIYAQIDPSSCSILSVSEPEM